ncbi:MAG: HAD-IIIA family hydrolase [Rhizobiales bacterium]|nr:HAD-IIIA family hydrolase [Hyphomicrobiales bacterium]
MKLIIIAGGKGTRLGLQNIPKPMAKMNGKPVLEYQIELAVLYGIQEVYILSGYLSEVIVEHFGDGSKWNIKINHIVEKTPLGTAGALKQLEQHLNERFLVFYADTVLDINLDQFIEFDRQNTASIASLLIHPNHHPYDSDLIELDANNNITKIYSKPHPKNVYLANMVNAALYIFSPNIFNYIEADINRDLARDIFPTLIEKNQIIRGYKNAEYITDMGTKDRFLKVENDIKTGKVKRLNNALKQKAIFIDRDGVINEEVDELSNIDDFKLLEGTISALKTINQSDYIAIVITNQPMIAKGKLTEIELKTIHNKMDSLLGDQHAFINDLFYCPHHPEKGWKSEVKHLKIDCDCRKPKPGMLIEAALKYNIDLEQSYFIGDRYSDVLAAKNAKVKSVLVKTGFGGADKAKYTYLKADFIFSDILEAANTIIKM